MNFFLLLIGIMSVFSSGVAVADDYKFNTDELEETSQTSINNIDISQFNKSSSVAGDYYVSVDINNKKYKNVKVHFIAGKSGSLLPQFTQQQIRLFNLTPVLTGDTYKNYQEKTSDRMDLDVLFPGSASTFDFSHQLLKVNIPQIYSSCQGACEFSVPSSQWDEGLNAGLLNYDVSGSKVKDNDGHIVSGDQFVRLNNGINLGAWRLRNQSTLDKPQEGNSSWDTHNTWLQRDIPALASSLYLGHRFSNATLFDGFSFQGISLATNTNMLSDKAQGYAPVIRGIARTANARVQISQNGNVIYQTYVPAGTFEIKDLYPQSEGDEFKVSIREADGSEHSFTQGWGSVSVMQRPGIFKYTLEAGRYDNSGQSRHPAFYQTTLFYGLPDAMTAFGGIQLAEDYTALDPGYAAGIGAFGALSADISMIKNDLDHDRTSQGYSYRLQYSANLPVLQTDLALSWAMSPDKGYISFSDAMDDLNSDATETDSQKSKIQLSVNQPLSDGGSLTFSLWRTEYWYQPQEKSLSFNYTRSWHEMTFSTGWAWTQNTDGSTDQQLIVNLQIPLSMFSDNVWMNTGINVQRPGTPTQSLTLNGDQAIDNNPLTWEAGIINGSSDDRALSASAEYKNNSGDYQAGYSNTSSNENLSWRAQGSVIATSYGVATGQPFDINNSVALVSAENAPGLQVANNPGVITDSRGLTVVPFLQPYRDDDVALELNGIDSETTLENTEIHLIPTEGAVALAQFTPHTGRKLLITLHKPNGSLVPFGATATADGQSNEGIVDDHGQVFISGAQDNGQISVKWGEQKECHSSYHLQPQHRTHLYELSLVCT
ncbi:hypothetical protein CIW69_16445 [Enterobacter cloacae]|nr:hypothetical protein CIW69_16445 [Enterobacter cloacae]